MCVCRQHVAGEASVGGKASRRSFADAHSRPLDCFAAKKTGIRAAVTSTRFVADVHAHAGTVARIHLLLSARAGPPSRPSPNRAGRSPSRGERDPFSSTRPPVQVCMDRRDGPNGDLGASAVPVRPLHPPS